jgi:hypothetical protein
MIPFLKTNFLYRTGNQLRRRSYHIDNQVKKLLSLNDPLLAFRVNFNEARINDETQKMISAGQRLVTDLTSLHDSLKTGMFMGDPLKIIKRVPERTDSANLLTVAPQTFLLLDKIHLDAAILQSFFQQRLSETIPSQFQVKFHFFGTTIFPVVISILSYGAEIPPSSTEFLQTADMTGKAVVMMFMSVSFLLQLKRYRIVKNTEADFLRVTKEGLDKAEEISRLIQIMDRLIRKYLQLLQASSPVEMLQSHQQKIFSLVMELQNSLKEVAEKT